MKDTLTIKLTYMGGLHIFDKQKRRIVEVKGVERGSTVQDVLKSEGFPLNEVWIAVVDGLKVDLDRRLSDGDSVEIFPPAEGG